MLKVLLFMLLACTIKSKVMSLEDAFVLALNRNLDIKQKKLEKSISKQDRWNNYTNFLPSLKYVGAYSNEVQNFNNSISIDHNLNFSISDILYNFKTVKKYDLAVKVKRNELKASKLYLKEKIIEIFINLLKIDKELKVSKIYLEKSLKDLELYNKLFSEGNISQIEIIELETNISQIRSKFFEMQNMKEELCSRFILLTGEEFFKLKPLDINCIDYSQLDINKEECIKKSFIIQNYSSKYVNHMSPITNLLPTLNFSLIYKVEVNKDFFKNWNQEIKKFNFNLTIDLFKWGQNIYNFKIEKETLNLEKDKIEEEKFKLHRSLVTRRNFLFKAKELLKFKKELLEKLKKKSSVIKEKAIEGSMTQDNLFKCDREVYNQEIDLLKFEHEMFKKFEEFKLIMQGIKF